MGWKAHPRQKRVSHSHVTGLQAGVPGQVPAGPGERGPAPPVTPSSPVSAPPPAASQALWTPVWGEGGAAPT